MSNQQALLDFLTYSYFKIVPKEIYGDRGQTDYSDYCIKKAIMKAYEDATNEGAYNTLFKKTIGAEKLDELKAASVAARKASAKFLLSQIQKLSSFAGDYDEWHYNTCKGLRDNYSEVYLEKDGPFFTYGNAQKWVNMSMKYIWMLGLLPIEVPETDLHVPIDSYILQKLKENNVPEVTGSGETFYYKGRAWSAMTDYKKEYMELQKEIRRIASPNLIQWENNAWIRAAEKRKKADLKKKYKLFWKE
jgi:hypothetical protein